MMEFSFAALPWRIMFAPGALERLPQALADFGFERVLVLTTPSRGDDGRRLCDLLGARGAGVFTEAVMHVPRATVTAAAALADALDVQATVALGGGSTIGLGKALALHAGLPQIAVPTTYAGSEMTNVWGITEAGRKTTGRDDRVLPRLTIYDPVLTLDLPRSVTGPSGLNAMAQAVVNVTAAHPNPIVTALALDGIRALAGSLPRLVDAPRDMAARTQALYGACLSGAALGAGVTGLQHRLSHTLGGMFNTPHADTHAILLPYTVAYNARAAVSQTRRVADALTVADAASGIHALLHAVSDRRCLRDLGLDAADLDAAAAAATETPCANPAPVTRAGVRELLERAWRGAPPLP